MHYDASQGGEFADEGMPPRSLAGALAELEMGDPHAAAALLEDGMVIPFDRIKPSDVDQLQKAVYLQGCHLHRLTGKGWEVRNDRAVKGAA